MENYFLRRQDPFNKYYVGVLIIEYVISFVGERYVNNSQNLCNSCFISKTCKFLLDADPHILVQSCVFCLHSKFSFC